MSLILLRIPSVCSLVKKTGYDTKITEIKKMITDHDHDKYITTSELSTLATNVVNTKIEQANVVTKTNFDNEVSSLDSKIAANKTKNEPIENKLQELKKYSAKADLGILSFLIIVN